MYSILPLLPFLIPLIGACLVGVPLPGRAAFRVRRWLYVSILLGTCVLLIIAGVRGADTIRLPFGSPLIEYSQALEFSFHTLALCFTLLLVGAFALVGISRLARPVRRLEAASLLILTGAGIGACSAANLLSLCLAWGLMDLALLILNIAGAPEESIPHAIRQAWGNLASTMILVVVTVLAAAQYGEGRFSEFTLAGVPRGLLVSAALLRLGVYPLPGNTKHRWEASLISLCAGGTLWLRIANPSSPALAMSGWLIPLGGWTLLGTGILAALSPDLATALPYMLLNGTVIIILGPLLNSVAGFPIAFLSAINLGLCLALVHMDGPVQSVRPFGAWAHSPLVIALASLVGWPLTLGFVARWSFLRLCWVTELPGLFLLGAISSLFASLPVWRRFRQLLHKDEQQRIAPRWDMWVALVSAFLIAALLIAIGLYPALLEHIWPRGTEFGLPSLKVLFSGNAELLGLLILGTALGPLLGGYALQRVLVNAPNRLSRVLDLLGALLAFDWVYTTVERILGRLGNLAEKVSLAVEESLYLGWTLVWSLALILYLIEG